MLALIALSSIWGYNWVVVKECLKYSGVYDFSHCGPASAPPASSSSCSGSVAPCEAIGMTILLGFSGHYALYQARNPALATGGVSRAAILVYVCHSGFS
jgi:hypothetical protein